MRRVRIREDGGFPRALEKGVDELFAREGFFEHDYGVT